MRAFMAVVMVLVGITSGMSSFAQGAGRSLDIQPGARQNGMGAAGVALESDPADAMWWNPAALGFAEWHGVNYTRARLVPGLADNVIYQHVAGGGRVRKGLGVGGSGTFISYGEPRFFLGSGRDESTEWSGAASAGYEVVPGLGLGVTAKYVKIDLIGGSYEGSTFGFDIGGLYRRAFESVRLAAGFNAQNLGPEMKVEGEDESDPLSRNLKVGVSATLPVTIGADGFEAGATVAFDFNHSWVTPEFEVQNYGGELYGAYRRWVRVAARAGYYDDELGEITDATFGFGLRVAGASVDYAEIPQARDSGLSRVKKWTFAFHTDRLLEYLAGR